MKVLVIDDSKDITDAMTMYCSTEEIECIVVNDGQSGLQTVREQKFDLIFLDLAMPEFSGVDVIHSLKKQGLLAINNVVIFTASSDAKLLEDLQTSGVKEILKKPISIDDLTLFIDKYRPVNESV